MCGKCSKLELKNGIEILELLIARNAAKQSEVDGKFVRSKEKALIRKLRRLWRGQELWILKNMTQLKFFGKQDNAPQDNVAPEVEIAEMMAKMPGKKAVADTIVATMGVVVLKAARTTIKALSLGISFSLSDPTVSSILKKKLSHELSPFRGNINATTTKGISRILAKAAEEGTSLAETSQLIQAQGSHGVFSQARGELIAQTELGRAYSLGQQESIQNFLTENPDRVAQKRWRTKADQRVREDHRTNAREGWIDFNQIHKGTNEATAPSLRDFGCRCVEEYRVAPPK